MSKSPLDASAKSQLIQRFLGRKAGEALATGAMPASRTASHPQVSDAMCRFDRHPGYEKLLVPQAAANRLGLVNPFFKPHEGVAGATTVIDGRTCINFSSYNYLGLAGHMAVNKDAKDAIAR